MSKQVIISQRGGRNFVARNRELIYQIDGSFVPARSEPRNAHRAAIAIDFEIIRKTEFECSLELPIRSPEWTFARAPQFFGAVHHIHGPLLKLYCVASRGDGHANEALREF
jgi:hypothetical protein